MSSSATDIARAAKAAFEASQLVDGAQRDDALKYLVEELNKLKAEILVANTEDLQV